MHAALHLLGTEPRVDRAADVVGNDEALDEIKKSGKSQIITLTAAEKAAWRKALEPVYTEMTSRVGKQILAEFEKEVNSVSH